MKIGLAKQIADLHKPSLDGSSSETLLSNSEFAEQIKPDGRDIFWKNYWQESADKKKQYRGYWNRERT